MGQVKSVSTDSGRKMLGSITENEWARLKKNCVDARITIRDAVEEAVREWNDRKEKSDKKH